MFRAEYQAHPMLLWERRPWNVRRSSKPFLDGQPPLGRVCCISRVSSLLTVCLYGFPWTTIVDESGVR